MKSLKYILPILYLSLNTGLPNENGEQIMNATKVKIENRNNPESEIPEKKQEFIENSKSHIGTPYRFNGRKTEKLPGMDCMGAVFIPYANTFNENWRDYSVKPKELIENQTMGKPVKGLDGVLNESVDKSDLEEGDIIYFLSKQHHNNERTLKKIEGDDYKIGHMGIYTDKEKNQVLNAFMTGTKVREQSIESLYKAFEGLYVTRPEWQ